MRRRLVAGLFTSLVVVAGVGIYFVVRGQNPPQSSVLSTQMVKYRDPKTGISVEYPETSREGRLSDQDKRDNIILRLGEREGETPMLVTLRTESGLASVAALARSDAIDLLVNNSEKALPQRFGGYHKTSSRQFDHKGRKAAELVFTYDSPVAGERIKQRFVILVKDNSTAGYLAMQSKEADFDSQNTNIFDNLVQSLDFE